MLTDTHCHLYSTAFAPDLPAVLARAAEAGIARILLPNVDHDTIAAMLALEAAHPTLCQAMMGLHPCHVADDAALDAQLAEVDDWHHRRPFVAVGEIGLDLFWRQDNLASQQHAFAHQCALAVRLGLPVSIHSREAMPQTIAALEAMPQVPRGILHCFTGTVAEALALMDMGLYLGIGGVVTHKKANLGEVVKAVGPTRLVLETDAPYLAPAPYRGKRNEPAYVRHIAQHTADVLEMPLHELAQITQQNAEAVFGPMPA